MGDLGRRIMWKVVWEVGLWVRDMEGVTMATGGGCMRVLQRECGVCMFNKW